MDEAVRLRLSCASHSYDGTRWQFVDLDLELQPGEITAILGPNGRGKSTLLRVLSGSLKPTSGNIEIRAPAGWVPQEFAGTFPYSVLDVVLMGRARHVGLFRTPGRRDIERAMGALSDTGIADKSSRPIDSLSGGERQLVLIARALAGDNGILLLDEPASALDLKNQDAILALLDCVTRRDKLAVAFTTHQPNHALAVADQVLLMLPEAQALAGPTSSMMTEANLEALYGLPVSLIEFGKANGRHTAFVPLFHQVQRQGGNDG